MTLNLNTNNAQSNIKANALRVSPVGSEYDSLKNSSGKFSYAVFHGGWWFITIPGNTRLGYETLVNPDTNQPNTVPLEGFRSSLISMTKTEAGIAVAFGTATVSAIAGCLAATPETLGASAVAAIAIAGGAVIAAAGLAWNWYCDKNNCIYYFNRVRSFKTSGN